MKTILRIAMILILAIIMLGAGYYLTFNNLSSLLATRPPHLQIRWIPAGLEVKTGEWVEVMKPRPALGKNSFRQEFGHEW